MEIAKRVPELKPDINFVEEAAQLHDIGCFLTRAPEIGCFGKNQYICHGYLGRQLLEKEGYPRHALVCERHVGVGLTASEIKVRKLPLPMRDMVPQSIEEEIVCFADKFYSKRPGRIEVAKSWEQITQELRIYGADRVEKLARLAKKLKEK